MSQILLFVNKWCPVKKMLFLNCVAIVAICFYTLFSVAIFLWNLYCTQPNHTPMQRTVVVFSCPHSVMRGVSVSFGHPVLNLKTLFQILAVTLPDQVAELPTTFHKRLWRPSPQYTSLYWCTLLPKWLNCHNIPQETVEAKAQFILPMRMRSDFDITNLQRTIRKS